MMVRTTKTKRYSSIEKIEYKYKMASLGMSVYNKRSFIRSMCGVACVVVGLVTSPVPFTSIPLYIVGGGLLGVDVIGLYYSVKRRVLYEVGVWGMRWGIW